MRLFARCQGDRRLKLRLLPWVLLCGIALSCTSDSGRKLSTPTVATPVGTNRLPPAPIAGTPLRAESDDARTISDRSLSPQDAVFPPRDEPFSFRRDVLEPKYRDQLRRPLQTSFVDIEGTIVWTQEYLRYRVNGCSHLEAVNRVFSQIDGQGILPVCATTTGDPIFPPRTEPLDFRQRLETKYRDELRRAAIQTAVDIEGDIVWTLEYLRYRLSGCTHIDAVQKVIAQIDGGGVQPSCTTGPEDPVVISCTYALLPNANNNISISGGTFTVNVSVQPGCAWHLTSSVAWVALNVTGSGSAPISYRVDVNTGPGRSGRLTLVDGTGAAVAAHEMSQQGTATPPPPMVPLIAAFTVTEPCRLPFGGTDLRLRCTFDARQSSPADQIVRYDWRIGAVPFSGPLLVDPEVPADFGGSGGGAFSVDVRLTVTDRSGREASTARLVRFDVPPPPGPGSCTFAVAPQSISMAAAGGTVDVSVATSPSCFWTADATAGFITIVSGASGAGSGIVRLSIAANSASAPRMGVVTVAGAFVMVTQSGVSVQQSNLDSQIETYFLVPSFTP